MLLDVKALLDLLYETAKDWSPRYVVLIGGLMVVAVAYTCAAIVSYYQEKHVRTAGVPVLAALVQAHRALFTPGWSDLPAQVVFTFDPDVPDREHYLLNLADRVFALKNRTDVAPSEAAVARAVTDELFQRGRRWLVPKELTGGPVVYLGHVLIRRADLAGGLLRGKLVLCKALPGGSGRVIATPDGGEEGVGESEAGGG